MKNMDNIVTTKFESTVLLDRNKHQPVLDLVENMIPNESGLYSIRVDKIEALPEEFRTELKKRDDTLLYIWKATRSIRERLWEEELHAQRPATFFRSIGAVLGYFPPIGSLLGKRNQHNYKFSPEDREKIIQWIETHILVNSAKRIYPFEIKRVRRITSFSGNELATVPIAVVCIALLVQVTLRMQRYKKYSG